MEVITLATPYVLEFVELVGLYQRSRSRGGIRSGGCIQREKFVARSWFEGDEKVAKATLIAVEIVRKNPDQIGFAVNPRRWVVGVSSEGPAVMSVKVRPELKDSGFEAREAPWRESKTAEPSDNMLERSMREASGCNVQ